VQPLTLTSTINDWNVVCLAVSLKRLHQLGIASPPCIGRALISHGSPILVSRAGRPSPGAERITLPSPDQRGRFVARPGKVLYPLGPKPDIVGPDFRSAARQIVAAESSAHRADRTPTGRPDRRTHPPPLHNLTANPRMPQAGRQDVRGARYGFGRFPCCDTWFSRVVAADNARSTLPGLQMKTTAPFQSVDLVPGHDQNTHQR
jgi:hypothetical protein